MKPLTKNYKFLIFPFSIIILICILFLIDNNKNVDVTEIKSFDLSEIKKRGKLIAVLDKNTIDYFVYKGRPQGFQLDILKRFADHLSLPLEIINTKSHTEALQLLNTGRCDILASNLIILKERRKHFTFSAPIFKTRQVLIQRKDTHKDSLYVNSVLNLGKKIIHVKNNSAYKNRLLHLAEEIGDSIYIISHENFTVENLIKMVSDGLIDYTVANENIAKLYASCFSNIDYSLPLSFEQQTAWVIGNNAPYFAYEINTWLSDFVNSRYFNAIYYKYFESERQSIILKNEMSSFNGNKISQYDDAIKNNSRLIGWDWRLLASLVYQESKFNNDTVSHRGAFGLMQLMPITAQKFNVDTASSPEDNIRAGVMYIKWLDKQLFNKVRCENERIKFILAAYNVGLGHIYDAQALAKKHGKNPEKWDKNVDYYLLNKSKPAYLNDTLVRNGSIKGKETYALVKKVLERYAHYLNLIEE